MNFINNRIDVAFPCNFSPKFKFSYKTLTHLNFSPTQIRRNNNIEEWLNHSQLLHNNNVNNEKRGNSFPDLPFSFI